MNRTLESRVDGTIAERVAKLIRYANENGNRIKLDAAAFIVMPRTERRYRRLAIKRMVNGLKRGGIEIDLILPAPHNVIPIRPAGHVRIKPWSAPKTEKRDTRCVCDAPQSAHKNGTGACPARGCPEYFERAQ